MSNRVVRCPQCARVLFKATDLRGGTILMDCARCRSAIQIEARGGTLKASVVPSGRKS